MRLLIATLIYIFFFPTHVNSQTPARIATFNIQNFGQAKANRPETLQEIVRVVRSYDVIALQEISDVSGQAQAILANAVNHNSQHRYFMSLSPRSGQQENNHTHAEQYVFFYKSDMYEMLNEHLYDDSHHDYFQREPWIIRFRHLETNNTFVLITIHTDPHNVLNEANALWDVYESVRHMWPRENNIIILGDLNADCQYLSELESERIILRHQMFTWVVPNEADTTVASSSCAYDRIIFTERINRNFYSNNWGVDYTTSRTTSDHYPIWFELNL